MQRRSVLAGLAAAVGGGAIVGTGAFTSVDADRDADMAVTTDDAAYLGLEPGPAPNGDFAKLVYNGGDSSDELLEIDFDETGGGAASDRGFGPNPDAEFTFDAVITVTNSGSQTTYFWAAIEDAPVIDDAGLYVDDSGKLLDGDDYAAEIGQGESVDIGVYLDTADIPQQPDDRMVTVSITADEENPADSAV